MIWFWATVGAALAVLLAVLALFDRRARNRGHQFRDVTDRRWEPTLPPEGTAGTYVRDTKSIG
jgi:hypothetical protein